MDKTKNTLPKSVGRHKVPQEGSFEHFSPDPDAGLTKAQAEQRRREYLFNDTGKKYSKTYLNIFVNNICTVFNLLAALVAVALAWSGAPLSQFLFLFIFSMNVLMGILQEIRAKRKIEKLNILSEPNATVLREGERTEIPIKEIVTDDILLLKTGKQIPVDCILKKGEISVNESFLTGESVSVHKKPGDKLYAGSFVVSGTGHAQAWTVGKQTYLHSLTAKAKHYKRPHSEIMAATNTFIRIIGGLMIIIAAASFYNNYFTVEGASLSEAVQATCAVIIGMIPSGMLLLTSAAMTMGILNLSQKNTLVQDMYSLEMLARVDTLCLDKTGTITDGKMQVKEICLLAKPNVSVEKIMGNFLSASTDENMTAMALRQRFAPLSDWKPTGVTPFSSEKKYSAVSFENVGSFVLGAAEFVLPSVPQRVQDKIDSFARQGLRVLLLAHTKGQNEGGMSGSLTPLALIVLEDNIRPDAADTIRWFYENDVNVKVISGDNPVTVSQVAMRAGVRDAERYLSLDGLSDEEVAAAAEKYTVFGRVKPEQKAILVKALKAKKHTVAMTGDGVNDILAMKESDCAITIAAGNEAARSVSNLVLTDNNFAQMPQIVLEGRRVINNVKRTASLYIMKTFFITMLAIVCLCIGQKYFFTTNNMLAFEFFVAGFPSFFLTLQPNDQRLKGKFFTYVLCHALPAAITLVLGVLSVYLYSVLKFGTFTKEYTAIACLVMTFAGVVMLSHLCRPFNKLRAATLLGSAVLCVCSFAVPLFAGIIFTGWSQIAFTPRSVTLLLVILYLSYPVSRLLLFFFRKIQKALER